MNVMRVMTRVFWVTVVFTIVLVAASIVMLNVHANLLAACERLTDLAVNERARILALVNEETGVRGFIVTRDKRFLDIYAQDQKTLPSGTANAGAGTSGDPAIDAAMQMQASAAAQIRRTVRAEIAAASIGDRRSTLQLLTESKAALDAYRARDASIERALESREAEIRRTMRVNTRRALMLPVLAGLAIVVAATVVLVLFRKLAIVRRSAERAHELEEVNRLMTIAEEMVKVGYWRFDTRTGDVYWSDEVYRIHGFSASAPPTPESVLASYHPDDRSDVGASIERALRDGTPYRFEARIVWPSGEIRTIVANGLADRERDGTIVGLFGAIQDSSDRKSVEREQQRLVERVSLATRAAQFGIWEWDLASGGVVWDAMMFALYGFTDGQFEPTYDRWAASLHPDDREVTERALAAAAAGHAIFDTEFRIVVPDGTIRSLRSTATLVCTASGSGERMIGTNWDITEFRTMAETLRITSERDSAMAASLREKNRLMNMAEQMAHVGHWRLDVRSRVVTWSEEITRAFGFTSSQPALAEILAAYHPDDRRNVQKLVERGIATGIAFSHESRVVRADGSVRHIASSGQPEFAADGTLTAFVGVFQDISDLRNAEREREELTTRLRIATQGSRIGIWDWDSVS